MLKGPKHFKVKKFKQEQAAYDYVCEIYSEHIRYLCEAFTAFAENPIPDTKISACYPYIKINPEGVERADTRLSYGFVAKAGTYSTTITRPADIFGHYLKEQIRLLLLNHDCPVEIGVSDEPIPIHYALSDDIHIEGDLDNEQISMLHDSFDMPDLNKLDDEIPNNTFVLDPGENTPLALFNAPRTDLSIMRLRHYTATSATHFQNFIIFTNYQFYIDEFVRLCRDVMTPNS